MVARSPNAARVRVVLVAFLVFVGMACTPGGKTPQVSVPPPPASTGVTETGPITLTVWDQESGEASRVWDRLNAEFEQTYPNVTVVRVKRDFDELKTLLRLALTGPH